MVRDKIRGRLGHPRMADIVIFATLARISAERHSVLQKWTARRLGIGQDVVSESLDRLETCLGKRLVEVGRSGRSKTAKSRPKRLSRLTEHGMIFGDLAICIARMWSYVDHEWTDPKQVDAIVDDIRKMADGWHFVENRAFRRYRRAYESFPHLTKPMLVRASRRDEPPQSDRERLQRRPR